MSVIKQLAKKTAYLSAIGLIVLLSGCSSGGDGEAVGDLQLTWQAPVVRENGNPIAPNEIAGFRVYYGTKARRYLDHIEVNDGSAVKAKVSGVPVGTYYAVVTTLDTAGRESAYSEEVTLVAVAL